MKTSPTHRSAGCAGHLNKALYIGALLAFFGLSSGGVIKAFPASFGVAPQNADATALSLTITTLFVGAAFLAIGTAQKLSGKTEAACAPRVRP